MKNSAITFVFLCFITHIKAYSLSNHERELIASLHKAFEDIQEQTDSSRSNSSHRWINYPWLKNTSENILDDLEAAFKNIEQNTDSVLKPVNIGLHRSNETSFDSSDSNNEVFYHSNKPTQYVYNSDAIQQNFDDNNKTPVETESLGCTNIFYQYKKVVGELEKLVDFSKTRNFNFEKTEINDNPSYIFLRKLAITPEKSQSFYFDKNENQLIVDVENLKKIPLHNFTEWLIFQKRLIEPLMEFQHMLKSIFSFTYRDFQMKLNTSSNQETKRVYVARN